MAKLARGLRASNPRKWYRRNRVNIPGKKEVIWEPIYDSLTYPAAGASSLIFFQDQIGKAGKTLVDTNLDLDGQISKGKAQLVTGIQVAFYSGATSYVAAADPNTQLTNDVYEFIKNGTLILKIQSKEYVRQAPLGKFPPVERISGNTFTYGQGGSDSSVKYAAPCGREFTIRDLLLESNQNFSVELRDLPPLPSNIDGRLVVTLNGYSARNAQ